MDKERSSSIYSTLIALYTTIIIGSLVLTNKIVLIGGIPFSACLFVFPLIYLLGDVIAEIYGYQVARNLIWLTLACALLFSLSVYIIVQLPSDKAYDNAQAYQTVFSMDPRFILVGTLAIGLGGTVNAYFLSKWKFLIQGKYFWLRSLGSSAIGELINSAVAFPLGFAGTLPLKKIVFLTASSYFFKLAYTVVFVWVSVLGVKWISRYEKAHATAPDPFEF